MRISSVSIAASILLREVNSQLTLSRLARPSETLNLLDLLRRLFSQKIVGPVKPSLDEVYWLHLDVEFGVDLVDVFEGAVN